LTGPGAKPTSYTMGTGSVPGVKRPGCRADHPPHLAPRLKKEWSYTCTPPLGLCGLYLGEIYFREIPAFFENIHTEETNALYGQNVWLFNVKGSGINNDR